MKAKSSVALIFAFVLGLGWSLAWAGDDDDKDKDDDNDVVGKYALLVPDNGGGLGFCAVKQDDKKVWAKVTVLNFRSTSSGTAWIKFDGKTVGRLDGTFSDFSGQAVFEGHFKVDEDVTEFSFDVRDHARDITDIAVQTDIDDDSDLTIELTNPKSRTTGISIKMGTCTFVNSLDD